MTKQSGIIDGGGVVLGPTEPLERWHTREFRLLSRWREEMEARGAKVEVKANSAGDWWLEVYSYGSVRRGP